ncbi:MAG: MBL fold metallo-hydrolase [Candidatus Aminicenantes bacterium]|nr:MBL fold metallo-hydrolase [Candidatus Aminicenantes bacterium]
MKQSTLLMLAVLILSALLPAAAAEDSPFAVSMEKLTAHVWICTLLDNERRARDYYPLLESRDGLVLVDTPMYPSAARALKAYIIKELKRNDFILLINTHYHWDHTCGNQFFSEATIWGHEFTPIDMKRFSGENFPAFITAKRQHYGKKGDARTLALLTELESEFHATPPSRTFWDKERIQLGDLSLWLFHVGRDGAPPSLYNHSRSDIFVYVPQDRVLCCGDVHYRKEWLDGKPGELPIDLFNGFLRFCSEQGYLIEYVLFAHDPFISK